MPPEILSLKVATFKGGRSVVNLNRRRDTPKNLKKVLCFMDVLSFARKGELKNSRPSELGPQFSLEETEKTVIAIRETPVVVRLLDAISQYLENCVKDNEPKEKPLPKMLTPIQASRELRLNIQTVMAWCREGKIQASKIGGNQGNGKGGKWLIPVEEVNRILRRQTFINGSRDGGAK